MRSFTATDREVEMLDAIARYHEMSKSATLTSLIKREFWRIFPAGTEDVPPEEGARVVDPGAAAGRGEP